MFPVSRITPYTSLIGFCLGFPTALATYYQAWKARQESRETRQGLAWSRNCLEFVLDDGTQVNLAPLEMLHTLPQPGEIVLLPGTEALAASAYRVGRLEHIYAPMSGGRAQVGQARLAKTVAHVERVVGDV